MAKKTIRITCGLGAEIVAKEITVIKKKVVTEEEQKQQVADELLNELSNNREAVEETMRLLAQLQKAGILDAQLVYLCEGRCFKIAVEQLNREPVKNALNNMMGAGEALSSVDPEITKQITSSLVTGLQFATDELNSGKNKSNGFL